MRDKWRTALSEARADNETARSRGKKPEGGPRFGRGRADRKAVLSAIGFPIGDGARRLCPDLDFIQGHGAGEHNGRVNPRGIKREP